MNKRTWIAFLLVLMGVSCNKDKFTTVPQISIRSISPSEVFKGDIIEVKGSFTDDEGDLDSAFVVYKYYNGSTATRVDTLDDFTIRSLNLPDKTRSGDITMRFAYGEFIDGYILLPGSPVSRDTTATLGLILKDKAGNRSNYAESERVRLRRQ